MKKFITTILAVAMTLSIVTGCSAKPTTQGNTPTPQTSLGGSILLKINPEIKISYNETGLVSKIEGINNDGKKVADVYLDYIGKETKSVVNELVAIIKDEGYFVSDDDDEKVITISLSKGSNVPSESFLSEIADGVQSRVDNMSFEKSTPPVLVKDDDDNEVKTPKSAQLANGISRQKALEIALAHAKVTKSDAREIEIELDDDDRIKHFEVEFKSGNVEYDFEISALDGTILKYDNDHDDDNDDDNVIAAPSAISRDKALSIALAHIGVNKSNITDLDIELDDDDNVKHYEIDFEVGKTEYKFDIDASSGKITKFEKDVDDDNDDDDNVVAAPSAISRDKALSIALAHIGVNKSNITDLDIELDDDDNVKHYEIDFEVGKTEYKFDIDASSGKITKFEKDDDDDNDDDNDDDDDDDDNNDD